MAPSPRLRGLGRALVAGWVLVLTLVVIWVGLTAWSRYTKTPFPTDDQCSATVENHVTSIDPEQALNASIIAGVAAVRQLPPRAVTIALATVYQESGMRNLDYGHADSLGLFQQRPSQGWGSTAEIMDPYYSSRAFYQALVKVPSWKTGDINDVAQAVQRSGFPEAYRQHVPNARALASALSGESPATFTCVVGKPKPADPVGMAKFLSRTLGARVKVSVTEDGVRVVADNQRFAWSAAHLAIANSGPHGLSEVTVGASTWKRNKLTLADWQGEVTETRTVQLRFDS